MTHRCRAHPPQPRLSRGGRALAARHAVRAGVLRLSGGIAVAIAAGALCAGCGSNHSNSQSTGGSSSTSSPGGPSLHDSAATRSGFLQAGPVVHLTVGGAPFAVGLVASRTLPGPQGKVEVPGRKWLEAEVQVENLGTSGTADIGWMDNALHVYATRVVTGESCAGQSVFVGLCTLSVGDFEDQKGAPGETFLDESLPPGGTANVWVLATELEDASTGHDVTLTLAPLIYGVSFAGEPVISTTDAPSGQVTLSAGGPRLLPRPSAVPSGVTGLTGASGATGATGASR